MKIWLINPYGQIPGEGWRDYRFTMLGKALANDGYQVLWWTANFSHTFKKFRSHGWKDITVVPQFDIRLVPTTRYVKNIGLGRVLFESTFSWNTFGCAAKVGPPDCIVATDPSQIVGHMALQLSRRFRVPLILDVFDLWPELFVLALPRWLRPFAPKLFSPLRWLRRYNLGHADALTSLCNTYLDVAIKEAAKYCNPPAMTIYNGIDVAAFRPVKPLSRESMIMASRLDKKNNDICVIYTGSLGNNYDIATLLRAGLTLEQRNSQIKIWIVGEGPLRPYITEFIETHRLRNVVYLGKHLGTDELIAIYQLSDIALCPYAPESNVAMPNKAYDYMAAGLPIVSSLRGELESFLRKHGVGIQYTAADPQSLITALESLANDWERRRAMAKRSFDAAMEFDEHVQYSRYVGFIENALTQYRV
jgi:glycosyltransferase involved in cell wall biosynthesis